MDWLLELARQSGRPPYIKATHEKWAWLMLIGNG
jgi:hypothetical protein